MVDMQEQTTLSGWNARDMQIVMDKYVHPKDIGYAANHDIHPIEAVAYRVATGIAQHATEAHLATLGFSGWEELRLAIADIMLERKACFNSPVLFNVGIQEKPQCWACLILSVDDSMDSIVDWWENETRCFLGGSGSGVNLSRIRADGEPLSGGKGTASGPLSFMRGADSIAGSIKSGGRTRRAAKMVILDIDHPDIEQFIDAKMRTEQMKRILSDAGFDMGLNGQDSPTLQYQNANNSVRVTDEFMDTLQDSNPYDNTADWSLKYRYSEGLSKRVSASELWRKIAQAAWDCGDPGVQFHDNVNDWHTVPSRGEIRASNPCSEYMSIDDSVCNLASHNLMRYYNEEDDTFDWEELKRVTQVMIVAMDILVDLSSYPNETIEKNARGLRNLGLGTTNIGALLMSIGLPYDSDEGRSLAAALHSYIMACAVQTSAWLAADGGPHDAWEENKDTHLKVLKKHADKPEAWHYEYDDIWNEKVRKQWQRSLDDALANGQRNSQLTVIAPTGTISFWLGAETTGIEPVFAVDIEKDLVGGGSINVSAQDCVAAGLERLRAKYPRTQIADDKWVTTHNPVFATSVGENRLTPEAHLKMMACIQPSISGAISKTVNMPADSTVEDVANIYFLAWEYGLKSVAIYRDSSKGDQPLHVKTDEQERATVPEYSRGESMPGTRNSLTHKFTIDNQDFYLTAGYKTDGSLGEIFLRASAMGSFVSGMLDSYAIAISLGLQHGISPEKFAGHFIHQSYEPHGVVISDSDIKMARSVVDYVWRFLMEHVQLHGHPRPAVTPTMSFNVSPASSITYSNGSSASGNDVGTNGYVEQCPACMKLAMVFTGTCRMCKACGFTDGGCG